MIDIIYVGARAVVAGASGRARRAGRRTTTDTVGGARSAGGGARLARRAVAAGVALARRARRRAHVLHRAHPAVDARLTTNKQGFGFWVRLDEIEEHTCPAPHEQPALRTKSHV